MPRVSVIIPTYNRSDLISEAIRSVLDQHYTDWELIILDDGSTDDTAQVVAEFGDKVIYIYQDNAGEPAARNAGFAASQGEFVSFLDSDDQMLPNNLENLVSLLDAKPEVSIAYGRYYWFHNDEQIGHLRGPIFDGQIFQQLLLEETMMIGTALIRRDCVHAIGGFDENIHFQPHWDFYLRLARAGYLYASCKQGVALLRVHPGNRGKELTAMLKWRLAILDRLFGDLTLDEVPENIRRRAYYKAYFDFALKYYDRGDLEQGTQLLKTASEYDLLDSADIESAAESVINYAFGSKIDHPYAFIRKYFEPVKHNSRIHRFHRVLLSKASAAAAFRHYQEGDLRKVPYYVLNAVTYDPSLLNNRGLVRIGVEGVVGTKVINWVRSKRLPRSLSLSELVAERTCIFLSPHFDDVVLSCGGTLAQLARRADVIMVTVFTADPENNMRLSRVAKELYRKWGGHSKPNSLRSQEDKSVAERLGIKYRWLGFLETIYRYPYLVHSNEIFLANFDPTSDPCYETIRDTFLQLINEHPGAIIFVPLGLGYHRDHLLVHKAIEDVKQMTSAASEYYYYEDYPYAATANLQERLAELDWKAVAVNIDITETFQERVHLISLYSSQLRLLFDNPVDFRREVMAYAAKVGSVGNPRERFWTPRVNSRRESVRSIQLRR